MAEMAETLFLVGDQSIDTLLSCDASSPHYRAGHMEYREKAVRLHGANGSD